MEELIDLGLFICPGCASPVNSETDSWRCSAAECDHAQRGFPIVAGMPALVDFANSVVCADQLHATEGASAVKRTGLARWLVDLLYGHNPIAPVAIARMLDSLHTDSSEVGRRPRILVIGGGTVGSGLEALYDDHGIDLVAFDLYASPFVQFIGDGHAIPLADGSVDGVVVQAVLEHVVEPYAVAREIHRVLRHGGIVYANTPFMQQVHEGPYDFARFTDSGHRYLFRGFERLDSGAIAGAGTALLWSIRYFARALTRSVRLGGLIGHCFFWLRFTDRFLDSRHSVDAASSVFFLGRKHSAPITHADTIAYYQGAIAPAL